MYKSYLLQKCLLFGIVHFSFVFLEAECINNEIYYTFFFFFFYFESVLMAAATLRLVIANKQSFQFIYLAQGSKSD